MIRVHRERALEPDARLLVVGLGHVEPSDVVVRPREAGIDLDRLLKDDERFLGRVVDVLQAPARGVERLRQARHLVIGQAVAEIVLRALPCLRFGRVRDAVEQHHACEPRAAVVGDADRGADRAVGALGLGEHREQRRGFFIDRQRVPAAVVDVRSDPPSSAREREGGIVPPRFDENPEDPARHDLA